MLLYSAVFIDTIHAALAVVLDQKFSLSSMQSSHLKPVQLINYRLKIFAVNLKQEMLVNGAV